MLSLKKKMELGFVSTSRRTSLMRVQLSNISSINTFLDRDSFPSWLLHNQGSFSLDCCDGEDFICSTKIVQLSGSTYSLTVNESILDKHDIVVLLNPMSNFSCMQSLVHNATGTNDGLTLKTKHHPFLRSLIQYLMF